MIAARDAEIEELKRQLHSLSVRSESHTPVTHETDYHETRLVEEPHARGEPVPRARRGKAPPVDPFTGEDPEVRIDEWLPALEQARVWNDWTEEELLMQLAGHLRSRALQEWELLDVDTKTSYIRAIEALRLRLDPGSRTLAVQDFRHTSQAEDEKVAHFIRRLERTFNVAYGREGMSAETRDTFLHGQLQDGLKHELMRAAAVSGVQSYKALCLTARNEEKRLAELKKRQQYLKSASTPPCPTKKFIETRSSMPSANKTQVPSVSKTTNQETKRCFMCHKPGHLARDCWFRTAGSSGHSGLP